MAFTAKPVGPFGAWLLDRFREQNWESYHDAKRATGISHSQWRAYVGGAIPRPPNLKRISEFFGVPRAKLDEMLGLAPVQSVPATTTEDLRDVIRETVKETLAQLGYPVRDGEPSPEELWVQAERRIEAAIRKIAREKG